jgi:gamma-glutamyl:cysteine ligase YbdK (ATP-grasp superfamily)
MGIEITQSQFDDDAYLSFQCKLNDNLSALDHLLKQPEFGQAGANSAVLGAELEMYIIDAQGAPLCINHALLEAAQDPQLTLEINQYNLEYNHTPFSVEQQPFAATEQEILAQLDKLNHLAKAHQGRVIPIGILPTIKPEHFGPQSMTNRQRYKTLVEQLLKRRGGAFHIDINGDDPLQLDMSDVTLEGANTSFQIHYRIAPAVYADTFNAFQLVSPLAIALAANSPGLFGHQLWQETRIPLFKQAIDSRQQHRYQWHEPARVNFGQGWVRHSALELFRETVNIYPPLLPICHQDDPLEQIKQGVTPSLAELRLHQSSVWLWNRPVYDDADGGHLRVELRALPAGPTAIDMVANAAFYIGLAEYYRPRINELLPALPFKLAEHNFYRAAQSGLDARILWPSAEQTGCSEQNILEVLQTSTQHARTGLRRIGISAAEIERYIGVIEARIQQQQTGASWQNAQFKAYKQRYSVNESQRRMLEDYVTHSRSNLPVSDWKITS